METAIMEDGRKSDHYVSAGTLFEYLGATFNCQI
jgi:hypothetical protein